MWLKRKCEAFLPFVAMLTSTVYCIVYSTSTTTTHHDTSGTCAAGGGGALSHTIRWLPPASHVISNNLIRDNKYTPHFAVATRYREFFFFKLLLSPVFWIRIWFEKKKRNRNKTSWIRHTTGKKKGRAPRTTHEDRAITETEAKRELGYVRIWPHQPYAILPLLSVDISCEMTQHFRSTSVSYADFLSDSGHFPNPENKDIFY